MVGKLLQALAGIRGVSFVSFVYTAKGTGETAKYLVNVGSSTGNLYDRDIALLRRFKSLAGRFASPLTIEAIESVLDSRLESQEKGVGNNSAYTCADTYVTLEGLPNVKFHKDTGEVYVSGILHSKQVITPGTYKKVNSAPLTIAKNNVRRRLPSSKFRTFSLGMVETAKVRGDTIEITN